MLVLVGVDFRKLGVWLSLSDVLWSWLRLQSSTDCIPHPYHMWTKWITNLLCFGWACGSPRPLILASHIHIICKQSVWPPCYAVVGPHVHWYACGGGGSQKNWGTDRAEWCSMVIAEAPNLHRLGPPLHCYAWVQDGVDFWKLGVCLSPNDVVRSWLRLQFQSNTDGIPHPYHNWTKCFSALPVLLMGIWGIPQYIFTLVCRWRWILGRNLGNVEPEWCCKVMAVAPN